MPFPPAVRRSGRAVSVLTFLLWLGTASTVSAMSQGSPPAQPDLAAAEANYERSFAAALDMPEDEPLFVIQAWGSVLMSAVVLDRVRGLAGGQPPAAGSAPDAQAVAEQVLRRWQQRRPESGGPDLFRTFRIRDPAEKRAAVLALLDRHPDDPLVVYQAAFELRQSGERERATAAIETFVARNPGRRAGFHMLAQDAAGNRTRLAEVLERWAVAAPGDPALVVRWLGTDLPRREAGETSRLLVELFARRPTGREGLGACLQVLDAGAPEFANAARACVVRIAGDPGVDRELAEQATTALAKMAATEGDRSALVGALGTLEPATRLRALISAAGGLKTPERCGESIDLLTVASRSLGEDAEGYASVASALAACSDRRQAQALYLDLLRRAPTDALPRLSNGWVTRVNGVLEGGLPAGAASILEGRQAEQPASPELFRALDLAYQLSDPGAKRFDLLRRWQRLAPASFDGERATELAGELGERGQPAAAVEVLERQLGSRFDPEVALMLADLYRATAGEARADRYAAELIAADDPWRVETGHHLAARAALLREDFPAAEEQYWRALAGEHPRRQVAVELLLALAVHGDADRLVSTARRICGQTKLSGGAPGGARCAADLLVSAGQSEAASAILEGQGADLPEDLEALRQLATTAHAAGEAGTEERALRRILELDPRDPSGWVALGRLLERQGRVEELGALLERSRGLFSPPPRFLVRAAARALTAAQEPRRAIDLLLEARGTLPATSGGAWSRSWIDHELRDAYRELGEEAAASAAGTEPRPSPAFPTAGRPEVVGETAPELRIAGDALLSGRGGHYDPDAATRLFARAAAMGDPLAELRLALLRHLHPEDTPPGEAGADELYRRSVRAVEARARKAEPYAQYLVGTALLLGVGGPADPVAARRWLEPAAEGGVSWAWHNLAWMQENGRGFARPDPVSALASYRRASEAGNTHSMIEVARLTLTPDGTGEPCREGRRWLERAAGTGNAQAASRLGKVLLYGRGTCVARDPAASLPWLRAAAAAHQPGGAYDLGLALLLSGGEDAARRQGAALLEEAVQRPDALAAETLAVLRAAGLGMPREAAEARRWMAQAARLGSDGFPRLAEQLGRSELYRQLLARATELLAALAGRGDAAAAAFLARLDSVGLGEGKGPQRVVELAREAAAAGDASAMRLLSYAYLHGEGVEADETEGRRWRRRCAEAGDSFCMMFHSQDLMQGRGGEPDLQAGLEWLRRSAQAGNYWAIADLGNLYDEGWYGLPRDLDEAARWKRRLADLGDAEAAGWLLYHGGRPPGPAPGSSTAP